MRKQGAYFPMKMLNGNCPVIDHEAGMVTPRQDRCVIAARLYRAGFAVFARQFIERLLRRLDSLHDHPQQGRLVPEAGRADIREIIFRSYRTIYRTVPDHLLIITILRGSRNLAGQGKQPWEEEL